MVKNLHLLLWLASFFNTASEQSSGSSGNFPPHMTTDFQKQMFILLKTSNVEDKRNCYSQSKKGKNILTISFCEVSRNQVLS